MRIRQARGCWLGWPSTVVLTATATSTCASLSDSDSRPASVTVPTDFDFTCLTTSVNGWERCWKSS
jgi:hypothetical protein